MGSEQYPRRKSGIYHSLPQFDPSLKDLTAFVTGASGISGFSTLRALLDSPGRWAKVYTLSRRPLSAAMMGLLREEDQAKVEHIACDFLKGAEEVAETISKAGVAKVDYVFFYSYLQPRPAPGSAPWSNAEELVQVNSALLENFLGALHLLRFSPKRVVLQTGAKNYGGHLGRIRRPALESDPQPRHLESNFYYQQEASLFRYCAEHPGTSWNVIRPAWIVGPSDAAQMNALYAFAVYAVVCARRKLPLAFPGSWEHWAMDEHYSTARLTGYLSEWAALEDKCADEAFNAQDPSPLSFDRLFERLADWFAVEAGFVPPPDSDEGMIEVRGRPGAAAPIGYGPAPVSRFSFTLCGWAEDPDNRRAWRELMAENAHLKHDPFENIQDTFVYGDGAFVGFGCMSMSKAGRLGWTGFVDTAESVFEMYREMAALGLLPNMAVSHPKALV